MTGLLHSLGDLKALVATDRRIWLAVGFIFTSFFIWIVTGSWREPFVEEVPEEWRRVTIPHVEFNDRINALNRDLETSAEERADLRARLERTSNEIATEQKEIDWQVDRLIESLDSMSQKVDTMVTKVGTQLVKERELERISSGNNKKKR